MNMNMPSSIWVIEAQTDKGIKQIEMPYYDGDQAFTTFEKFVAGLKHQGWQEVSRRMDGTLVMMIRRGAMNSLRLVEIQRTIRTTHFSPALLSYGVASMRLQGAE